MYNDQVRKTPCAYNQLIHLYTIDISVVKFPPLNVNLFWRVTRPHKSL